MEWQRRRDYFPAKVAALKLNSFRKQNSDKYWTADDILHERYPRQKKIAEVDDGTDHGARGDWRALKSYLKGGRRKRSSYGAGR